MLCARFHLYTAQSIRLIYVYTCMRNVFPNSVNLPRTETALSLSAALKAPVYASATSGGDTFGESLAAVLEYMAEGLLRMPSVVCGWLWKVANFLRTSVDNEGCGGQPPPSFVLSLMAFRTKFNPSICVAPCSAELYLADLAS